MKKLFVYLCCLFVLSSFENKRSNNRSIYQLSYQHGSSGRASCDSIVLSCENETGVYNKISIFRRNKLIFQDTNRYLEVIGMPYSLFIEQEISFQKEYFYIFKLFNAPQPDNYLVIKTTPDSTFVFGTTKPSTSEIFGDIDGDGKFEIGGWIDYCEEYDTHKCPDTSLFQVFKIDKGFPVDTALTTFFRNNIINKSRQR